MSQSTESRPSCFARLLDVRTYVLAARAACHQSEPPAALFMVAVFGAIALVLLPLWWTFDLSSTWAFTTSLRDAAAPVVEDMAYQAEGFLSLSVGALLTGVVFTAFTLLPSLFELAFPTVAHPLLSLILLCSIVFDYVTDWGKVSSLTAGWTENATVHFLYTVVACLFVSVGIQAVLVCCLTVVLFGVLRLLAGGARQAQAVVIDQKG